MIIPVILAGGTGTRLWPLSRGLYPKQYLPLVDGRTMIQDTIVRLRGLDNLGDPLVLCNEEHRFVAAEQLREIGCEAPSILLEPAVRNTAPAIISAAMYALRGGGDPLLLVLPADHHVRDEDRLRATLAEGAAPAESGGLVTFGIVPDRPETGYGYIQKGEDCGPEFEDCFRIKRFVEKPDLERAKVFMESGSFLWNSGMFLFRASTFLEEAELLTPEMTASCRLALERGRHDLDFYRLQREAFESCPSDSIDYAVMERTGKGMVVPLDAGWNDVGSWDALWDIKPKDEFDNVRIGDVVTESVERSYLHSTGRLLAVVGVQDHIVVETADAVMVAPKDKVQDVKALVARLKEKGRTEAVVHRKVYRPWGAYENINIADRFQVKRITVKPGAKLSLQKHFHRAEHWVVVSGTAVVTRNDETLVLSEDESTYIPLGAVHRLENPGKIPLELIEVQTGSYLGEDDIVRTEDVYGRSGDN